MTTRNQYRAAAVAALYILDRDGVLEGMTQQQRADLLDIGHRSSALRYMRDVAVLHDLVPDLLELARKSIPFRDDA